MSATIKERRSSTSSETPEDVQEETLPLYQEFQVECSDAQNNAIPSSTATPDEVRDYLASLLRKRHDIPDDQVRRVVANWRLGTGRELRIYTAQMYLNIFGSEYGWTLYRDVRLELYSVQPKNFIQDGRLCEFRRIATMKPTILTSSRLDKYTAVALVLECLSILLIVFHDGNSKAQNVLCGVVFAPVTLVAFMGTVWSVLEHFGTDTPPQVWIEQELQRCTRNNPPPHTL